MTFLIDTNVVSEWMAPTPDPRVRAWLTGIDDDAAHLSVVTIGELRFGIERLAHGDRRTRLGDWIEENLWTRFEGRILPVDVDIAQTWGRTKAACAAKGHTLPSVDAFIAATALVHDLTVVTRNGKDFESTGVRVENPWMN